MEDRPEGYQMAEAIMKNKPGFLRAWLMRLFGKDLISCDSFIGISSFHADGSIDVVYQRLDGSYYWKRISCGLRICLVGNERETLDEDTSNIPVRSKNCTPAKALLNDRS